MSIITRIPGVTFTDASLPKLYRDNIVTAGTKWLYDAKDAYSYAKQAAPVAGTDAWVNLTESGVNASFGGSVGFSGGGFDFLPASGSDIITLPASGKVAANTAGFLAILWIEWGLQTSVSGYGVVGGCMSGTTAQWGWATQWNGNNGNLTSLVNGLQPNEVASLLPNIAAGTKLQLGLSYLRKADGTMDARVYRNGAHVTTQNMGNSPLVQPAATNPVLGATSTTFSPDWKGKVYRSFFDDLSTTADPLTLVAADYAANVGRFS